MRRSWGANMAPVRTFVSGGPGVGRQLGVGLRVQAWPVLWRVSSWASQMQPQGWRAAGSSPVWTVYTAYATKKGVLLATSASRWLLRSGRRPASLWRVARARGNKPRRRGLKLG